MISGPINVVGNAESLLQQNYGELIDQYPTIRFNFLKNLDKDRQGSRWDYMATSNPKMIRAWNGMKIPFHTWIYTKWQEPDRGVINQKKFDCTTLHLKDEVWRPIAKMCPKRPTTGLMIMHMLDFYHVNQVNIFGFDWKETKTYYNKENVDTGESKFHDYEFEKMYCLGLIEKNICWKLYK